MLNSSVPTEPVGAVQPAHWRFWGTLLWGILIALVFLALQAATVLWVLIARNDHLSEAEFAELYASSAQNGYVVSLATMVTGVVCCALIAGIVKLKKRSVLSDYLALRSVSSRTMLRWLALLVGLIVLADVLTILLGRPIVPDFMSGVYATADPAWMLWTALIVAAPLFEETFFRGFLFKGFESSFLGSGGTVLATAGLWALMHVQYDAYGVFLVFGLGLLLGVARARTGSLMVPLTMHATANLIATIETVVLT